MNKVFHFIRPAPLDAWVLITLLYWLIAAIGSMLWYVESPKINSIKLPMPLLSGALAMIAGLSLVAFNRGVSFKILALFSATIVTGGLIFLLAALWMEISTPVGLARYPAYHSSSFGDYANAYLSHPVVVLEVVLGAFLLASSFRWVQKANQLLMTWVPRSLSFLNKHRTRLMITFVVIMLPATVLRNAIDPEFRSSRYIVTPVMTGLFAVLGIIAAYLVGRFVLNRKWLPLKICAAVVASIGICGYLLIQASSRQSFANLQNLGSDFAWAFVPVFFTFAFLAAALSGSKQDSLPWKRQFSVWSLLLTIPLIWLCSSFWHQYDPLVVVRALVTEPTKFTQANWLSTAKDSRTVQRFTRGAVRVLDQYGSPLYSVKIRDERDADVFRVLLQHRPSLSGAIVIENMQPFVNTKPLAGYLHHVGVLSGELTPKQMVDLCKTIPSLVVADVKMPSRNVGATLPLRFGTDSDKPIPGFAAFVDAYFLAGKVPVSINSQLTIEDWNALLRVNQRCAIRIGQNLYLPAQASEAAEIDKQKSLSGISIDYVDLTYSPDAIKLLETDIQTGYLAMSDEALLWDLAFTKPNITRAQPPAHGERVAFEEAVKRYHWGYGWDEDDEITHLWLPDIDELDQHSDLMNKVRTLRFDRRGFIGFRTIQSINFDSLGKLPNLQRLYLGSGEYFGDLQFLAMLPKLEHLQIQAQNRKAMRFTGFEVCQNLKTIRFFGTPHAKTISELAGLKNLRRVEIVDDESSFKTEPEISKLQSSLPEIEIQIIAPDAFQPDLSDKLQQHLEEIRRNLD